MAQSLDFQLSSNILKGPANYHTWKFGFSRRLMKAKLWDYPSGIKVKAEPRAGPEGVGVVEDTDWVEKDQAALTEIVLNIEPDLYHLINQCTTSKEAWDRLATTFQRSGEDHALLLLQEIQALKFEQFDNMYSFLQKMSDYRQRLATAGSDMNERQLIHLLLLKLPDQYEIISTMLQNLPTFPTFDTVYNKLIQEESKQLSKESKKCSQENVMYSQHNRRHYNNPRNSFNTARNSFERRRGAPAFHARGGSSSFQPASTFHARGGSTSSSNQHAVSQQENSNYSATPSSGRYPYQRSQQGAVTCYRCKKIGHVMRDCRVRLTSNNRGQRRESTRRVDVLYTKEGSEDQVLEAKHRQWFVDSGASQHMSNRMPDQDLRAVDKVLVMADGNLARSTVEGTSVVHVRDNQGEKTLLLKNVLYSPQLNANLLSVPKITNFGHEVKFTSEQCIISSPNDSVIATGSREGNIYVLDTIDQEEVLQVQEGAEPTRLWHRRLAHLNENDMKLLHRQNSIPVPVRDIGDCIECHLGKMNRSPQPKISTHRADEKLGVVVSDTCGPVSASSIGNNKYFVTFLDEYSRYSFVYLIESKSQVFDKFKIFHAQVERQLGLKMKVFRSDNGLEFKNNAFSSYLQQHGIIHQFTVPYTPSSNGLAERLNRTLCDKARCMLADSKLSDGYWAEAIAAANYLRNRSPTSSLQGVTPYEKWRGFKPNLGHLKVFGCSCMVYIHKHDRSKFQDKGEPGIMLGYSETSKGYKVLLKSSNTLILSRDVKFYEAVPGGDSQSFNPLILLFENSINDNIPESGENLAVGSTEEGHGDISSSQVAELPIVSTSTISATAAAPSTSTSEGATPTISSVGQDSSVASSVPLRKSSRVIKSTMDKDFVYLSVSGEPDTYQEAVSGPNSDLWKRSMEEEMASIEKNSTWILVDLPAGRKAIKCRWVFRLKQGSSPKDLKFKSRLVAKGCSQQYGLDYTDTFSPVMRLSTLRLLLALAAHKNLEMHQIDITSAYLHGRLNEEIYMEQPQGFVDENHPTKVCKLEKALYGLKQAGRVWFETFKNYLLSLGFKISSYDSCLFFRQEAEVIILFALHVDDGVLLCNCVKSLYLFKKQLSKKFAVKDLGELSSIVGFNVKRDRKQGIVMLNQAPYIEKLLVRAHMENCNAVATPMEAGSQLSEKLPVQTSEEVDLMERVPYRELTGLLNYIAVGSRPDISFSVSVVSKYNESPRYVHFSAVKRIIRYLSATKDKSIVYGGTDSAPVIRGYCDADWANNYDDRRSYSGVLFTLFGGPILWSSKKQTVVALSTTEAEYLALSAASREAVWLMYLIGELPVDHPGFVEICCDNQGAVCLSKDAVLHSKSKHIHMYHHFVREKVAEGIIKVIHIPGCEMIADILTKALPRGKHVEFMSRMGII